MAVSIPITPSLGIDTAGIYTSGDYNYSRIPLGTTVRAQNGRVYTYAQASGTVANDTDVILTEPALTFAAGAGAFTTRAGAVVSGNRCWIESKLISAIS